MQNSVATSIFLWSTTASLNQLSAAKTLQIRIKNLEEIAAKIKKYKAVRTRKAPVGAFFLSADFSPETVQGSID